MANDKQAVEESYESSSEKMKNDDGPSKSIFPPEVIIEILSWLPIKSLIRLQLVCKDWRAFINDRYFKEKHRRCIPEPKYWYNVVFTGNPSNGDRAERVLFCDGCDGLLLLMNISSRKLFIWNPATRRVLQLPDPHSGYGEFALRFAPATGNYRVEFIYNDSESGKVICEVFTPDQSKAWRRFIFPDACSYPKRGDINRTKKTISTVSAGEAIHCIVIKDGHGHEKFEEIVSLDVGTECFTVNSVPKNLFDDYRTISVLDWDGKLAFADIVGESLEVMVLEDYKKKKWSERKNVIRLPFMKNKKNNDVIPLFTKQGEAWFWLADEKIVITYNIETGTRVILLKDRSFSLDTNIYFYKPSFVTFEGMQPDKEFEKFRRDSWFI